MKNLSLIIFMVFSFSSIHAHHERKMKIAIVTVAIGDKYEESCYPSTINKLTYSQYHGYDFFYFNQSFDESRHPAWSKIKAIQSVMSTYKYDWIFWTDADSMITNHKIKLESLVDKNYKYIGNIDYFGNLNSGQFLIKCDYWSLDFLKKLYAHEEFIDHPWWENMAIIWEYENNEDVKSKFKLIDCRLINSYPQNWQPGDFIIHFAGTSKHNLYNMLSEYKFKY